jgi:hypothetical protein
LSLFLVTVVLLVQVRHWRRVGGIRLGNVPFSLIVRANGQVNVFYPDRSIGTGRLGSASTLFGHDFAFLELRTSRGSNVIIVSRCMQDLTTWRRLAVVLHLRTFGTHGPRAR